MLGQLQKLGGGLRNVLQAGIRADDKNKTKKLELMRTILQENRGLREQLGIKLNQVDEMIEQAAVEAGVMTAQEASAALAAAEPAIVDPIAESPVEESETGSEPRWQPADALPQPADAIPAVEPQADATTAGSLTADAAELAEIDLDDQPWEAPPQSFASGEFERGSNQMAVANSLAFTPPALQRK